MHKEQLEHHVAQILDTIGMDEYLDDADFPDINEKLEYVLSHDGQLDQFKEDGWKDRIKEVIRRLQRFARCPEYGNVRRYPSVEVHTGKVDADGKEIVKRVNMPIQRVLFNKSPYLLNQLVDYHRGLHDYHGREANRYVKAGCSANPDYQQELPFPELEDDEILKSNE